MRNSDYGKLVFSLWIVSLFALLQRTKSPFLFFFSFPYLKANAQCLQECGAKGEMIKKPKQKPQPPMKQSHFLFWHYEPLSIPLAA